MKNWNLPVTVFCSGAVVMMLELTGARLLSPYLGSSTFIWTSLIGIILASLSFGYYLGGRAADRNPSVVVLANVLFAAGVLIALMAYLQADILALVARVVSDLRVASVVASVALFTPASVILGMVSPYAIRLQMESVKTSGATVGRLYAISTMGSIVGTFLTGFVLFSYIGSLEILVLLSVILVLLSLLLARGWLAIVKLVFLVILLGSFFLLESLKVLAAEKGIVDMDSQYSRIRIFDDGVTRYLDLEMNPSSAIYLESDELVFEYTKGYELVRSLYGSLERVLVIGGGTFTYPRHLRMVSPQTLVDAVEIDPALTDLAAKYFRLDLSDEGLRIINEDGRTYLNNYEGEGYDLIFGDAFKSFYTLPQQLTTVEAVKAHYDALAEDGAVVLNIAGSVFGETGQFFRAELATYKEVFPQVEVLLTRNSDPYALQNVLLVAFKEPRVFPTEVEEKFFREEIVLDLPILTDNFAPVEKYMMSFFDYLKL